MNNFVTRIFEMLSRVRQFGLAHASRFPAASRGRELLDLVGQHIGALENHSTTQAQHALAAREKTGQKVRTIKALRGMMVALSRTARSMSKDRPEMQDKFRLPEAEGVQDMLATARAFVVEIAPLKDEFIARGMAASGMAATFLEDFGALIAEVEANVDARVQKSAARVSATAAVKDTTQDARNAVRELDAIVRNLFADDRVAMAEWKSASRVEHASRRAETEETAAPPPPPPSADV